MCLYCVSASWELAGSPAFEAFQTHSEQLARSYVSTDAGSGVLWREVLNNAGSDSGLRESLSLQLVRR